MTECERDAYRTWSRTAAVAVVAVVSGIAGSTTFYEYIQRKHLLDMRRAEQEMQIEAIRAGLHQQPLLNGQTGWVKVDGKPTDDGLITLDEAND